VHCALRPRTAPLARWTRLSRRPPSSETLRNQSYGRAGALACAPRRNDVTRCNGIAMPPCGPLCANITSTTTPKVGYIAYHNASSGGPSHGHRWLVKFGRSSGDTLADRQQTDRCSSQYSATPTSSEVKTDGVIWSQTSFSRTVSIAFRLSSILGTP